MSSPIEFKATAPAKIILFGEHAVVYGKPALAVPVLSLFVTVTATPADATIIQAADLQQNLPDGMGADEITEPLLRMITATAQHFGAQPPKMLFRIASSIPVASGLGSGAAVSAALGRAVALALDHDITPEALNGLVYDIERIHHGTPSGIDNTVIVYEKPVYFIRGQAPQTFEVGRPVRFLIADTGRTALTRESVGDVRKLFEANQPQIQPVLDAIGQVVDSARHALMQGDSGLLGQLMVENHRLLQILTVSSPELDHLVAAGLGAGALGAKLSGGGRGGNMIALVTPETEQTVAKALSKAGAVRVIATTVGSDL